MKMKLAFIFYLFFIAFMVEAQSALDTNELNNSYNDQAVEAVDQNKSGQAVQYFERALRSSGKQRKIAAQNLDKLRKDLDLPEHTILHFGWGMGIGKISDFMISNGWLIISFMSLMAIILFYFQLKRWSWTYVIAFLSLSVVTFMLSYFQNEYRQAEQLIVIMEATALREKPYGTSEQKQILFEGQMATVEQLYEGFYRVQTDTYESGWIDQADARRIWED
mgnify:CR=1 FL=1